VELEDFAVQHTASQLKIDKILKEMNEETRSVLLTALRGSYDQYPHASVAQGLTKHGYHCSEHAVKSWRKRYVENANE